MLRRHSVPLCYHQAPGAACSPALRPLCPGGGLRPPCPRPSPPVSVPEEAFGLARRTLALSSWAPTALVLRAPPCKSARGPASPASPSFCPSPGYGPRQRRDAVPAAAPRGRSAAPGGGSQILTKQTGVQKVTPRNRGLRKDV